MKREQLQTGLSLSLSLITQRETRPDSAHLTAYSEPQRGGRLKQTDGTRHIHTTSARRFTQTGASLSASTGRPNNSHWVRSVREATVVPRHPGRTDARLSGICGHDEPTILPATRHTAYSHPFTTPAIDHARAHGLREGPTVHASHTRGPHTMPREHASAFSLRCRNARPSATRLATADGGALCNRMHRPPAPHSQRPSTRSACAPPLPAVGPLGVHIASPPDCNAPHIPASSRKP